VLGTSVELLFRDLPLLLPLAGNAVMLLVYTCAFALMYHYLPDRRVHWKQAFLGGLITAALFLIGRWAIAFYLAEAAPGSPYGSAGALVIVLVWVYYAAMIFFGGALITAVIDERWRERRIADESPCIENPRKLPVVLPEDVPPPADPQAPATRP